MANFYQDDWVQIYQADCREILWELPDESIQCCVTSPPYWGLRDYGLEPVVWGGDEGCEHEWVTTERKLHSGSSASPKALSSKGVFHGEKVIQDQFCLHCSAWLGSLGLESTPELYVQHLVEIFRMVRRVLRKDGTVWLNMGDSYFSDSPIRTKSSEAFSEIWDKSQTRSRGGLRRSAVRIGNLKPKDLCGIPWSLAFALREDGWWLRSDIIWSKPNPMPESVTDRPTKSHEYVFLLSKSQKYYYDGNVVREPYNPASLDRYNYPLQNTCDTYGQHKPGKERLWEKTPTQKIRPPNASGRNRRTVWTIPTQPFPEAHFAVFPTDLVEPMIKAGSKTGDTVLDPFAGTGTVAYVAKELNRKSILIEPKEEYCEMAVNRVRQEVFDFNRIAK